MIAPAFHIALALANFTNATGGGDIFLVAVGAFIGTLLTATVVGIVRWAMSGGRDAELERLVVRALAEHDRQSRQRADEETLRAAGS